MNIEFIKSADNKKYVTNQNCEIFKSLNSKRALLLENKLELLEAIINKFQKDIKDNKLTIKVAHFLFYVHLISLIGTNLEIIKDILESYNLLTLALFDGIFGGLCIYLKHAEHTEIREQEANEIQLSKALEMKDATEQELELSKEGKLYLMEERAIPIDEPISLVKENEQIAEAITEELNNYLDYSLKSANGRVLKRSYSKNKR